MHAIKRFSVPLSISTLLLLPIGAQARSLSHAPAALVKVAHNAKLGAILVNAKGMTLYYLETEKHGTIKCTASCVTYWPPLLVSPSTKTLTAGHAVTGKLGTILRPDGKKQLTYNKWPLYFFAGDKKPGDTKGQGVAKVWWVITVKAASSSGSPVGGHYGY